MKKQKVYALILILIIFIVWNFKCIYAFEEEDVISDVFLMTNEPLDTIQKKILDASSAYYKYDSGRVTVNMKVTKNDENIYSLGER